MILHLHGSLRIFTCIRPLFFESQFLICVRIFQQKIPHTLEVIRGHFLRCLELPNLSFESSQIHPIFIILFIFHQLVETFLILHLLLGLVDSLEVNNHFLKGSCRVDILDWISGKLFGLKSLRLVPQRVRLIIVVMIFYLHVLIQNSSMVFSRVIISSHFVFANLHSSPMFSIEIVGARPCRAIKHLPETLSWVLFLSMRFKRWFFLPFTKKSTSNFSPALEFSIIFPFRCAFSRRHKIK